MPDFSTNISNLKLERYLLRELPAAEMRAMETLLNSDAVLRERLRILQESNAAILRDLPPNIFAQRLHNLERRRKAEASVTGPERGLEGSTPPFLFCRIVSHNSGAPAKSSPKALSA
jgi:hypothetical protein